MMMGRVNIKGAGEDESQSSIYQTFESRARNCVPTASLLLVVKPKLMLQQSLWNPLCPLDACLWIKQHGSVSGAPEALDGVSAGASSADRRGVVIISRICINPDRYGRLAWPVEPWRWRPAWIGREPSKSRVRNMREDAS